MDTTITNTALTGTNLNIGVTVSLDDTSLVKIIVTVVACIIMYFVLRKLFS